MGRRWNWRPIIAATPEVENAIRDLKYGVGLNRPSGRFAANGAWLAVQGRWLQRARYAPSPGPPARRLADACGQPASAWVSRS